jgi:hypothetical protein
MRLHHQQCFLINNGVAAAASGIVCLMSANAMARLAQLSKQTRGLIAMARRQ